MQAADVALRLPACDHMRWPYMGQEAIYAAGTDIVAPVDPLPPPLPLRPHRQVFR